MLGNYVFQTCARKHDTDFHVKNQSEKTLFLLFILQTYKHTFKFLRQRDVVFKIFKYRNFDIFPIQPFPAVL